MKKDVMSFVIGGVFFFSLAFFSIGNTENSSVDWVNYSSDNYGNVYSYKMGNIQNNGGKYIVQVWEKEVYSDKGEEELIQKMTKNGLSTEGYNKLKETMSLYEIDCNKKMKNISSITDYDMEGKVLLSYSYDKKEWGFIVPDSKVDSFRKEVCK